MSGQPTNISSVISRLFNRKRNERRKRKALAQRRNRTFRIEDLEKREMFAVTSIALSGGVISVATDNNATSVTTSVNGSNIRVTDITTNRFWDYASTAVTRLDFTGGAGADRFVNNVSTLATRAWGNGGNDYLEGYNAVDEFYGGDGNDTLVGYGGNDILYGGNGNDIIKGMAGDDNMYGDAGDDYLDGGTENDKMFGGDGDDTLLGGAGDDQLVGDGGNDHLNGQAGNDRFYGGLGDDTMISIDSTWNEYLDGGAGSNTDWIDSLRIGSAGTLSDTLVNSTDFVQRVGAFTNGADKTLDADNITDASDIGLKATFTNTITVDNIHGSHPLFATATAATLNPGTGQWMTNALGPRSTDAVQGAVGDCFLISSLSSIAAQTPNVIMQNVVDFDDGTYGVHLGSNFYRVDNELAINATAPGAVSSNLRYAKLGAQNDMWVAVVEKAFATYYHSAGTWSALDNGGAGGAPSDVFNAFNMRNVGAYQISANYGSGDWVVQDWANRLAQGFSMTTNCRMSDGSYHVFSVCNVVRSATGTITGLVLRNPHGADELNTFTAFGFANAGVSVSDGYFTVNPTALFYSGGWVTWGIA